MTRQIFTAPILLLGRNSSATNELVFIASQIPPVGFKKFLVLAKPSLLKLQKSKAHKMRTNSKDIKLNHELSLAIDQNHLVIKNFKNKNIQEVSFGFKWYEGYKGKNSNNIPNRKNVLVWRNF